jgi:hypothetical protein
MSERRRLHRLLRFITWTHTRRRTRVAKIRGGAVIVARKPTPRQTVRNCRRINWTGWRDPMTEQFSLPVSLNSTQEPGNVAIGFQEVLLELLVNLEISLRASQEALLARDIHKFEQLSQEQVDLQRALSMVLHQPGLKGDLRAITHDHVFWSTHMRVLELTRVHSALLRRAQRSLRRLSCWRAGTNSQYAPLAGTQRVVPSAPESSFEEV